MGEVLTLCPGTMRISRLETAKWARETSLGVESTLVPLACFLQVILLRRAAFSLSERESSRVENEEWLHQDRLLNGGERRLSG